jgi:hypothetical protein
MPGKSEHFRRKTILSKHSSLRELGSGRALSRIAQLGNRIVEVVERTRALVQRVPPRKDDFEINEAGRESLGFQTSTRLLLTR